MFLNIIIGLALFVVFITLVMAMLNMRHTGMEARLKSNKLMRVRIAAQAVAILVLFLSLYLKSKGAS